MSGHSKWSTIKRAKEANDAKKGALFTKLARAITIAAKGGGADPDMNMKLRFAVEKARQSNMPKENIERAIEKGVGEGGVQMQEMVYEGYGPLGVPIVVEAATDNKNRTAQEIKNLFERGGGTLGAPGSVSFQFERTGQLVLEKGDDPEGRMLELIDLGAEDLEEAEDADCVCIINHGKVVALGSPAEIKSKLVEEYVLMNAKNKDQLEKELKKLKLKFQWHRSDRMDREGFRIDVEGKMNAQQVIQMIKTPLSGLRIHNPSLERAYLEIVNSDKISG